MNRFFAAIIILTAVVLTAQGAVVIDNMSMSSKSFAPSEGERVTVGFDISEPADVKVSFYNRLGKEVKGFDLPGSNAGGHEVIWDGRNPEGRQAKGRVFLFVIEAVSEDGEKTVFNLAEATGGQALKTLEFSLDDDTGKVEYVLPSAAMIRMRAGLKDGMLAGTIFDWMPSSAGRHSFVWDGMDSSGSFNLLRRKDVSLRIVGYSLPGNTVFFAGKTAELDSECAPEDPAAGRRLWRTRGKAFHYGHNPLNCHEPEFKVIFPGMDEADSDVTEVSGQVPVRVVIDPDDAAYMVSRKYEIMFYVDGIFIYETEDGSNPFNYIWDTANLSKGPHILTVNLLSYDDHIGVMSRRVIAAE